MPKSIFTYIFQHSWREQIILFAATLIYLPLLYMTFELPKLIVNDAIGEDTSAFPKDVLGVSFEQVGFLILLCCIFLTIVLIAGGMRYALSVYKGVLAELMLRRLRYDLYTRVLRFPLAHLQKITGGEIVAMSTSETEEIGRYMGVAVANPALQGGTLLTALGFLFAQDVLLGAAALVLFPVQAWLVPKFQRKMNEQSRMRLANVRMFAGHVSETIEGAKDIIAHNTTNYELAKASERLGILFRIRKRLYELGNQILFLNTFFTQLTPFLFYAIGGYLVIQGDLTLGALVAVIAAYREAAAPWNELLENYQQLEDNRVKYALLVDNFMPEGLRDLPSDEEAGKVPEGTLQVDNVTVRDGEELRLSKVDINVDLPAKLAFLGPPGSGVNDLPELMAGLRKPDEGRVIIGGEDVSDLPPNVMGSFLAYVDGGSHVFTGTWRHNLYYGLKNKPIVERELDGENLRDRIKRAQEAARAGNTTADFHADWVDYRVAGAAGREALEEETLRLVRIVGLEGDLFEAGMREKISPGDRPDMMKSLCDARRRFRTAIEASDELEGVVQFLDINQYNTSANVADNLLFATPLDATFQLERLGKHPLILKILTDYDLLVPAVDAGREATKKMLEMFRDLPKGDERLSRFNLIQTDDRPAYEARLGRTMDQPVMQMSEDDRAAYLTVAFKLTPARHRLGLMTPKIETRLLQARAAVRETLPDAQRDKLAFFDPDEINGHASVYNNVLNGYIVHDKSQHKPAVDQLIRDSLHEVGLNEEIMRIGLDANVGTSGGRLTQGQRQKLAVARCLVKRPRILIVNEALNTLPSSEQAAIQNRILEECENSTLIWADRMRDGFEGFDDVFTLRGGRVTGHEGKAAKVDVQSDDTVARAQTDGLGQELEVVAALPAFKGVNLRTLQLLAFTAQRQAYKAGEKLMVEGGEGDSAFVLVSGEAAIKIGADGHVIGELGPGSMIGEVALLQDIPRTATVEAKTDVTVLSITREAFIDLVCKEPSLGIAVSRHLAGRLAETTAKLEEARSG